MNRSFPLSRAALLAAAAALALSACSPKDDAPASTAPATPAAPTAQPAPQPTPQPAPASPPAPPPEAPASAPQAEVSPQAKLNLYIDCYNRANGSFHRSLNRYASWVKDMDAGPTGNERVVYGLYEASGEPECQLVVQQAQSMQPAMPELDQAAAAFAASLTPLNATIGEAYVYYDRENYKDDGFAKGKTLHQTLAAQAKTFRAASEAFSDALDDANDARQRARLDQIEKANGRDLAWFHLSTMVQAKELLRLLTREGDVDLARAQTLVEAFEKTIDDMEKAPGDRPMMWSSYASDVDDYRKAAKELYRRLRDKTPYTEGDKMMLRNNGSGWMVSGSPDKLVRAYNEMVDSSNRLD